MYKSVMKKTCASDYIAIKKQNAIFNGENKNNMVINAIEKCCLKNPENPPICKVRTSKSYEIINDFYNGRRYNKEFCEL